MEYYNIIKDNVFDEYARIKKRFLITLDKIIKLRGGSPYFVMREKEEVYGPYHFEPFTFKIKKMNSGPTYTLSGDVFHFMLADFPDVSEKIEKYNKKLKELGTDGVPIPDPNSPGLYLFYIMTFYEKIEKYGLKTIRLP